MSHNRPGRSRTSSDHLRRTLATVALGGAGLLLAAPQAPAQPGIEQAAPNQSEASQSGAAARPTASRDGGLIAAYSLVAPTDVAASNLVARAVVPRGLPCPRLAARVSGRTRNLGMSPRVPAAKSPRCRITSGSRAAMAAEMRASGQVFGLLQSWMVPPFARQPVSPAMAIRRTRPGMAAGIAVPAILAAVAPLGMARSHTCNWENAAAAAARRIACG